MDELDQQQKTHAMLLHFADDFFEFYLNGGKLSKNEFISKWIKENFTFDEPIILKKK